jgi:hypothetical protein
MIWGFYDNSHVKVNFLNFMFTLLIHDKPIFCNGDLCLDLFKVSSLAV